jgi:hypothetical protein
VPGRLQDRSDLLLESEASVVRSDGDLHGSATIATPLGATLGLV